MAEARQMSLFGVDQPPDEGDELDRLYAILLEQLSHWHPGRYAEDSYKDKKIGTITVMHLLRDAGEHCKFKERVQLLKRLRAEGRVPETEVLH